MTGTISLASPIIFQLSWEHRWITSGKSSRSLAYAVYSQGSKEEIRNGENGSLDDSHVDVDLKAESRIEDVVEHS